MNLNPFIDLLAMVLRFYAWILIGHIALTWLIYFEILNRYNNAVHKINEVLYGLTEPVLRRVRRYIPSIGGVDISPVVVFLLIQFVVNVLYTYFYHMR